MPVSGFAFEPPVTVRDNLDVNNQMASAILTGIPIHAWKMLIKAVPAGGNGLARSLQVQLLRFRVEIFVLTVADRERAGAVLAADLSLNVYGAGTYG